MKYLLCVILLLFVYKGNAQDLRLAGVEYFTFPDVRLKDDASNKEVSFQEFGMFVNYPLQLKNKKTILLNGIQYGMVEALLSDNTLSNENQLFFHKLSYSFCVIHMFNEKWTFVGRISPTLASDFEDKLSGHDFILQGTASLTKRFSPNILGGVGLIYTTRLGKPRLYPSIQYQYRMGKHDLNIFFPVFSNYSYQLDSQNKFRIGLRMAVNGANFNTSSDNYSVSPEIDRFNYVRANIGPFVSYRLGKMVLIEISGGISTFRKYEFEDVTNNHRKFDSQNGGFINIGLNIVPPQNKK